MPAKLEKCVGSMMIDNKREECPFAKKNAATCPLSRFMANLWDKSFCIEEAEMRKTNDGPILHLKKLMMVNCYKGNP